MIINIIQQHPNITIEGLYTHFATADEADKTYVLTQLANFNAFIEKLQERKLNIPIIHAANSGALIDIPGTHFNMVRPGISLYGW